MSVELKTCPQSATLTDYLLGLLPPDESESCEAHLSNCPPCVETIQGLELKDTLHDLAANAIDKQQADANEDLAPGDSGVVGGFDAVVADSRIEVRQFLMVCSVGAWTWCVADDRRRYLDSNGTTSCCAGSSQQQHG